MGSTIHGTATPHSRDILAYPGPDTPKAVTNINTPINTPHRRRSRESTPADLPTRTSRSVTRCGCRTRLTVMKNHAQLRVPSDQVALTLFIILITVLVACGPPLSGADPAARIQEHASRLVASGPYRPPSTEERQAAVAGFGLLLKGAPEIERATTALAPLGLTTTTGKDPGTGRRYILVENEPDTVRAWGTVLIDLSVPPRLVIEVPHPKSDRRTEQLGVELFRRVPGSVLLIAGAHRRAAHGIADVAHREESLFHALAVAFAAHQLPQLQLHGFHNDSLEDTDVVISAGAGVAGKTARAIANNLDAGGLKTCRAWEQDCGNLEGKTNVQGIAAAKTRSVFTHIEVNRTVREDRDKRATLVDRIASVVSIR